MANRRADQSVFNEPQFAGEPLRPDPGDRPGQRGPIAEPSDPAGSAYDEPTFSRELAGLPPEGALTYANWLRTHRAATSPAKTWLITLLIALSAGPWAVLGAIFGHQGGFGLWAFAVFAPVVEEATKIAIAFYVIERKPYLIGSPVQIVLAALAGGLAFAFIENLMYLHVYIPNPPDWLVWWRWTVCVTLHASCSTIAGFGLVRVWTDTWRRLDQPRPALAFPWWLAAVVIHGIYNATAVIFEVVGPSLANRV